MWPHSSPRLKFALWAVTAFLVSRVIVSRAQETSAGWVKYEQNPVLGGTLGLSRRASAATEITAVEWGGDVVNAMNGQPLRYADSYSLMQRLSRIRPGERWASSCWATWLQTWRSVSSPC